MTLPSATPELYASYVTHMQQIADIKNALAVLQWDQETYLPPKGAAFRSRQMATLSETAHRLFTAPSVGSLLTELAGRQDLQGAQRTNVLLTLEDFTKQNKFSSSFIRSMSEAVSRSFHDWLAARKENRFGLFEQSLDALIGLKRQEADIIGYAAHPYDALLDEFEKGSTVQMLDGVFAGIRQPLKDLLDRIGGRPQVDDSFLRQFYPRQQQWDFGMDMIGRLGFDFEAGRQDISEHPFTTSFGCQDVRITTRVDQQDFGHMLWSCIHETGHALYEQGLPAGEYGLPSGEYASLSIHESQSRLWENHVGRSLPFWKYHFPRLQAVFPGQLGGISTEAFYRGINRVAPTLIRTEADELTYHFHVMVRYELEKLLMEGSLSTSDIPGCWRELYQRYLGLEPPDDRSGCLQDVHWSHGSFGYFPTYSLGSFYAAQFFQVAEYQRPEIQKEIPLGHSDKLLGWLRENIHRSGRLLKSEDLCLRATGQPLEMKYFLGYILDKYTNIYNL